MPLKRKRGVKTLAIVAATATALSLTPKKAAAKKHNSKFKVPGLERRLPTKPKVLSKKYWKDIKRIAREIGEGKIFLGLGLRPSRKPDVLSRKYWEGFDRIQKEVKQGKKFPGLPLRGIRQKKPKEIAERRILKRILTKINTSNFSREQKNAHKELMELTKIKGELADKCIKDIVLTIIKRQRK